jgi:predicted dehydrogenase
VICEKPATATLAEALQLEALLSRGPHAYAIAYTYAGYPLVREARELCRAHTLGKIRKVVVEYSQGWLSERVELGGNKQASWRTDPSQAGAGGCVGDIGVHAFHLLEFITGRKVAELCAQLSSVVPGRVLDDDCNVLLRLDNGAPGLLHATQIAAGERNRLQIRVSGERGSLAWSHEEPQCLHIAWLGGRTETRHAGGSDLSVQAKAATRLPAGHPEGYIEAFANIYRDFAAILRRRAAGEPAAWSESLCGIREGVRGMMFIERAVASQRGRAGWVPFD